MQRNEISDKDQVSERAGAGYPGWEVGDVEFEIARDPRETERHPRPHETKSYNQSAVQ